MRTQIWKKPVVWYFAQATLLLILVAVFAGCVQAPSKPGGTPIPGPAIILDYHRTGGIAGFDDHLVIFENGATVISTRMGNGYAVLNRSQIEALNDVFAGSGFSSLNPSYPAPAPGADYFSYQITYRGQTVTTEDTGVPSRLIPVISALNEMVYSGRNTSAAG